MCHSKLGDSIDSWKNIEAPDYVVEWIKNGVPVPLTDKDICFELDNRKLSLTLNSNISALKYTTIYIR